MVICTVDPNKFQVSFNSDEGKLQPFSAISSWIRFIYKHLKYLNAVHFICKFPVLYCYSFVIKLQGTQVSNETYNLTLKYHTFFLNLQIHQSFRIISTEQCFFTK